MAILANGMAVTHETVLASEVSLNTDTYLTGLNNNLLVVGGSGSGKSSSVVMPNIMQLNSSIVAIDPKGALYADLAPGLAEAGYLVDIIDFAQPKRSTISWNPIATCENDRELHDLAMALVTEHGISTSDPYWQEQAASVFMALVKLLEEEGSVPTMEGVITALDQLHEEGSYATKPKGFPSVSTYSKLDERFVAVGWTKQPKDPEPESPKVESAEYRAAKDEYFRAAERYSKLLDKVVKRYHLEQTEVVAMLHGEKSMPKDRAFKEAMRKLRRRLDKKRKAWAKIRETRPSSSPSMTSERESYTLVRRASEAYSRWLNLRNNASTTWACIMSSLAPKLDAYRSPELLRLLGGQDAPAADLTLPGRRVAARFIVISDVNRDLDLLAGMFTRQTMRALVQYADAQPDRRCNQPVRIILDDFANMTRMPEMDVWIAAVRSREIWISVIVQSMSQLDARYGCAAETIVGNCDVRIYFTPSDVRTASDISARVGLPEEFVMATSTDHVWVMKRGEFPMLAQRYDLGSHPNWNMFWNAAHPA